MVLTSINGGVGGGSSSGVKISPANTMLLPNTTNRIGINFSFMFPSFNLK